ncbi:MAG: tetratricopeptide repeat protein, partial [Planctomycetaceae bacterium]
LERLDDEIETIGKDEKLVDAMLAAGKKLSSGDEPKLNFFGSYILAKLAARNHKSESVIEFYRFALKARRNQAGLIFMELGRYLYLEKKFNEAADVFKEAAADPAIEAAKADYLLWLSRSQEMAGDTKGALDSLQEALKLQPNHPELLFHEAWIYTHSRQWDEAIRKYEALIARFPNEKEFQRRCLFSISNVHVQKGDMRAGEKILEDVLAKEGEDPSVNNDLGYLYADQGKNLEQAEKMIRKAVAAEPDNAAYLDSMGWVLFKLGKYEEALPHLEKAISKPTGSDATIWEHLGDCYEKLNKADKAHEAYEKAIKDAKEDSRPDEKLIQRLEEKLKKK